jgi:hypothetical protein
MQSISEKSVEELKELVDKTIETEASSQNGTHYSLSVNVKARSEAKYILEGKIHDNSSFRYELLEEKLVVEK